MQPLKDISDSYLNKYQGSSEVTKELVDLAYAIDLDRINDDTLKTSKALLLDGIGVFLAGINHSTVKKLTAYFQQYQPENGIEVVGHSLKSSLPDAAFIYGTAIHSMDFEPMFLPPTHAVSPILAPLLAIAQTGKLDGKNFLKAFIAGIQFEAGLRIASQTSDKQAAENQNHFPFEKKGFHPPGTVGTLGSALTSSIALGLSKEECSMAIGYAASRSSGISGNIGTMTKATHCGNAARSGLEAALFTSFGLTSSTKILETGSGWAEVFGGSNFNFHALLAGMEQLSCFTEPGFAFKKWPSHTAMQIAINGALNLHESPHETGEIKVSVPVFNYCNRPFPEDSNEARFSFQYNIAISLIDGQVNSDSFSEEKLHSEKTQDYLRRIKLILDPNIPRDFGKMHIRIQIGHEEQYSCDNWPGHWKTPMTEEELSEKFTICCSPLLKTEDIELLQFSALNILEPNSLISILKILNTLN